MGQEEIIAGRYARGLAESARDAGRLDRARDDLRLLADLLDPRSGAGHSPELYDFLNSPAVPPAEKLAVAGRILEKTGVGGEAADFLKILIDHGRIGLMPKIAVAFADVLADMTGELTAVVHTARPLSPDQGERLARALGTALGGKVRLHQQVEPGLLAGARVVVGDKTFDGTVLGRLEELKHRMIAGSRAGGGALPEAPAKAAAN